MIFPFRFPFDCDANYPERVAYFCMEYGIHQSLKTYAGGLGYLAGSHMRSAFELKQPLIGIGILWKYGYYDQVRKQDQTMDVLFQEKVYGFLEKTNIRFSIRVSGHEVFVTAFYLPPHVFGTAPVFFLSTDLPENDYLARTICHKLYDSNPETKIAAAILLGQGGAKLLECLGWEPDMYHLNESHGLPLAFYLYHKFNDPAEVKKRLIFTNHTPEAGGNERTNMSLLVKLGFFGNMDPARLKEIIHVENDVLDYTYAALQLSGIANGVSRIHGAILQRYWRNYPAVCPIISITNAQDSLFWSDNVLYDTMADSNDGLLWQRKQEMKKTLFEEVADQTGEMYDPGICTIVFAKRFTAYKRPELLLNDMDRFQRMITNTKRPIQIIWAGKPYPVDFAAIATFDKIVNISKGHSNCSVLVGYEMRQSKLLKGGADIWLNTPRVTHEASGTSGMSAAMNGAVNVSMPDGWFPEFAKDKHNGFVIPPPDASSPDHEQDELDANSLYDLLEKEVIPMYYDDRSSWLSIMKNGMKDILPEFDSKRMAKEYYGRLYSLKR